ncbi:hypothetical protein OPW41_23105 [Vibrio europaeus]|uniref:SWIM-type domain-containing protein n=1 Tax=Vibrio europaeus TaxID=300876 RepID=A0A178JGU8_9VIBR|nr:hypothetical protein [Vibrio europaeus]MDC5704613.1 hypothetical protein [Vibrio europaeus]MDC5712035.1 hypothetical protein [Vibrio europaeus]MDC5717763.1 hypothetical protein [Vibrio europaeus]MDC5718150.1 hypothetical protein [Vibrio europaeus]MDC5727736.1 hypothetical protein [Vibrio europaeus]
MNYKEVEVQGSTVEPYTIALKQHDHGVSVSCNCKAGSFGKLCKHKVQVVKEELEESNTFSQLLRDAGYGELIGEVSLLENELAKVKRNLDKKKKLLIKTMS